MGIGGDGYLYFTCAQLRLLPHWNDGKNLTQYPYRAYKVKLPTERMILKILTEPT
jgi:hypothetical protein